MSWKFAGLPLLLSTTAGCELVASASLEKQWQTESWAEKSNRPDLVTRAEVKMTKVVGRDAKLAKLKRVGETSK